jgi:hypothetical protein
MRIQRWESARGNSPGENAAGSLGDPSPRCKRVTMWNSCCWSRPVPEMVACDPRGMHPWSVVVVGVTMRGILTRKHAENSMYTSHITHLLTLENCLRAFNHDRLGTMSQFTTLQSRFLQLPREIRDEIYRYYVYIPAGYFQIGDSTRLCTKAGETPTNLSLLLSCKQVAVEMHGVALKENKITFRTILATLPGLPQDGRFRLQHLLRIDRLWMSYHIALRNMLSWAAECVYPENLDDLHALHPHNDFVNQLRNMTTDERTEKIRSSGVARYGSTKMAAVYVVEDLLKIISGHPSFFPYTAKEYNPVLRNGQIPPYLKHTELYNDRAHSPQYTASSQLKLLQNTIRPWRIPSKVDLRGIEELLPLCLSRATYTPNSSSNPQSLESRRKRYWSATACAIRFLESFPSTSRTCIRNIRIEEDHQSNLGLGPEWDQAAHAHGLIPFCKENPRLRIEARVDLWKVLIWACGINYGGANSESLIGNTARWFQEAAYLKLAGMPVGQYRMEFMGADEELMQRVWDGIKKTAASYEAARSYAQKNPDEQEHCLLKSRRFRLGFPQAVKDVMAGDTPVRFPVDLGEPWDLDQEVRVMEAYRTVTPAHEWGFHWRFALDVSDLIGREDVVSAVRSEYFWNES